MKGRMIFRLIIVTSMLLSVVPVSSVAQEGEGDQYLILLKSREFIPSPGIEPPLAQEMSQASAERRHILLQFERIPTDTQFAALEAAGVRLLAYVPNYAWFASLPPDLDLKNPALAPIRWMGAIQAADRVAPFLRQQGARQYALNDEGGVALDVRFFSDVPADEALRVLSAVGAIVEDKLLDFHRFIIRLDPDAIDGLAVQDGVQWIANVSPPKTINNDGIRTRTNVNTVHATPYNLSGSGVDLGVWDGGKADNHVDFSGRLTVVDTGASVSDHATHVAGTMAGDGSNSASQGGSAYQWKGMAPGADIFSYYWDNNLTDHNGAINTYGIELSQNSWGFAIGDYYGNCDLYGNYESNAQGYDDIVTGLYGKRITIVFSAGNERNDGDCGMSSVFPYINYANVGPPSTAKNIITVGATNSDNDSMTDFSSWGPLDDGRLKPDIVAPGCENGASIRSTFPGNTYGNMCGTSMAAPAVSGISGLIIEQYRATFSADPLPSTVKALLVQTAVDLNDGTSYYNPGPDYASGYGRVDAQAAADAIIAGEVLEDQISSGQIDTFTVNVPSGTPLLKVTLAWDDEPGAVNANPALVNNLDLVLVEPNGSTTHLPWVLNPSSPSSNATTGVDSVNNVEQVQVGNPAAGTWEVRVVGTSVPVGPQLYSLAGESFGGTGPIDVGPLAYDAHVVDDDNAGNSLGNGDGIVNPGETIELYVDLLNNGADQANDVYATISTADPYVTFIFNTSSDYGAIPGGAAATNLNDFDFTVASNTPPGHVIHFDLNITASNGGPWSDSFDITVSGGGSGGSVVLISDQTELGAITYILDDMGLTYDVINNNWDGVQGIYTSDYSFLSNYAVVVWYASGSTYGRLITQQEHDALEQFLQAGGRLLVTGYDTLGSPTDALLAALVRSSSSGDGPFTYDYTITDGDHPITNGPYGSFPAGTALVTVHSDHDQAEADTGLGAHTVAELAGGRDKIMASELPSGGIVVYWNGNRNASDWTGALATVQVEFKRDEDGQPFGLPPRPQNPSALHEGEYVVDGVLSDTPAMAPAASEGGQPERESGSAPQAVTVINFDDTSQPCFFADAVALRDEYISAGVSFDGPGANDGGAILNECGNFNVSGHSSPNFLAFNASASLSDGGISADPEEIIFSQPVISVEILAGSNPGSGQPVTMEAFNAYGSSLGSDTITLAPTLQPLSISVSGIVRVVISSPASVFVLDDLVFKMTDVGPQVDLLKNTLHWLNQPPPVVDPHEPNDTPATCTPIFFDVAITDPTISPPGDYDYYCFDASGGQTIAADIDASVLGSSLDSVLTLFDSDGTSILIQNDDYLNLDSYLEYSLPHDGTFYLRVRSYAHPCCGGPDYTYSILLSDITAPRSLPFFDDMESGANGWWGNGFWHQVQDGVSPYPNSFSPTHSWWYGQDSTGDYDNGAANSGDLTSPPIEIPPGVPAELSFWQWYETEPMLLAQNIYFDAYHDADGDDNISGGIYTEWATDLSNAGYTVVEYNQPIDPATLSGYQVLALFDPEVALSSAEIAAINDFMNNGGRVVALGEYSDLQGVNSVLNALSSAHGVVFNNDYVEDSTNNDGSPSWPLIYNYADHPLVQTTATTVLYAGCSFSLSGAAQALATGDSDTTVSASLGELADSADEHGNADLQLLEPQAIVPGAPVVMAYAPVGAGEFIGIGDSGLWINSDVDGDGTQSLFEYDNAYLSHSLFGKLIDAPYWDQKWVQISVDGGPFQDLLQVTGGPLNAWHQTSIDLSAFAGSTVRLRFHFDTFDGILNGYRGWYVDDVLVDAEQVGPLAYSGHIVDDDNSGESSGDGDGVPDAGETIELYAELHNAGSDPATNVQACITEDSPYVSGFLFNTCSLYGDIPGDGTALNSDDYDFTIDPAAPSGHVIHFDLDVTADNEGPWSTSFDIVVGQGIQVGPLLYVDVVVDDDNIGQSLGNGDGQVNPGEVIELFVQVGNAGNAIATSVIGSISENSPYVNGFLYNTSSSYGDIPGGATASNSDDYDFAMDIGAPNGHLIPLCLDLTAANGGPWSFCFELPVVDISISTALRVSPADQDVPLSGGSFDVDILVENVTHLGAFQFDLVFDPSIAHVNSVNLGPFLGSSGCTVSELAPIIDNFAGRATYGAFIIGNCTGPSGDGALATVSLQPMAVGGSDLMLENQQLLNSDDPPLQITPVNLFHGQVTVTDCFFADLDCDGDVDIADIYSVAYHWGCQCGDACYVPAYDLNDNCSISVSDIQIVACYFGWPSGNFSGCWAPTNSAVEPLSDQLTLLRLLPERKQVMPSDTFSVELQIEDIQDLAGFEAVLHYDPQILQFEEVALGDFLTSSGNTAQLREAQADVNKGTIALGAFSLGEYGNPTGSGTLVTLTFTVKGLGQSVLGLSNVELSRRCGTAHPLPTIAIGLVQSGLPIYLPLVIVR